MTKLTPQQNSSSTTDTQRQAIQSATVPSGVADVPADSPGAPQVLDAAVESSLLVKDRELREHLESLSLETLDQYADWCRRNGFGTAIRKNWKQRCKEKYFAAQAKIESRRKRIRRENRKPNKAISQAFNSDDAEAAGKDAANKDTVIGSPWAARIQTLARGADEPTRAAFRRIIERLHETKSALLKTERRFQLNGGGVKLCPVLTYPDSERQQNSYLEALATVSLYESRWLRPIETWKPSSKNIAKQFASICRHLFAKYPTPAFIDCVWFENDPLVRQPCHEWFIELARGVSVRKLDLPIRMSKKAAHHFCQTPKGLSVMSAIRRAQVHACGGTDQLLPGLLTTQIATTTQHDEFWLSVIQWLVDHPMLNPLRFGPLIDYFHYEKFGCAEGDQSFTNYSPRGRSPDKVMLQMNRWHAALRSNERLPNQQWERHPTIAPFRFFDTVDGSDWEIEQLLSTDALQSEGRVMRHCVLSCARHCLANKTTIWSMTVQRKQMRRIRKALTIEVSPSTGRIVQVRGRANRGPRPKEVEIIQKWAQEQGLKYRKN